MWTRLQHKSVLTTRFRCTGACCDGVRNSSGCCTHTSLTHAHCHLQRDTHGTKGSTTGVHARIPHSHTRTVTRQRDAETKGSTTCVYRLSLFHRNLTFCSTSPDSEGSEWLFSDDAPIRQQAVPTHLVRHDDQEQVVSTQSDMRFTRHRHNPTRFCLLCGGGLSPTPSVVALSDWLAQSDAFGLILRVGRSEPPQNQLIAPQLKICQRDTTTSFKNDV